jgi:magnesium and cobalt transporter
MAEPAPDGPGSEGNGDRPLRALRNWLRHWRRSRSGESMRDSLEEIIEEREEVAEPIDPQERMLIGNILKLHELSTSDVMVPRVDILALDVETPFPEVVRQFVEQGHSRMPVYRETLDDVIGFVHIKDVLARLVEGQPSQPTGQLIKLMRKVLVVAPSMRVLDLLLQMRVSHIHMAMVVDEFGGIDGLVTIEDLIEEIVGEIEDEHDIAEGPMLIERADGSIIADARTPIETFEERFAIRLLPHESEEDVDTLGGLVFTLAGRVPSRGEVIVHPSGAEFEVLDADPRRVKRLRIRGVPRLASNPASKPASQSDNDAGSGPSYGHGPEHD